MPLSTPRDKAAVPAALVKPEVEVFITKIAVPFGNKAAPQRSYPNGNPLSPFSCVKRDDMTLTWDAAKAHGLIQLGRLNGSRTESPYLSLSDMQSSEGTPEGSGNGWSVYEFTDLLAGLDDYNRKHHRRKILEIIEAVLSNYVPQLQQLLRTIVTTRSDHSTIGGELDSLEALDNLLATYALDKNAGANPISNATYHYQRPEALPRLLREASRRPPLRPLKCGHPSWIEEQRVYRALWRLQFYFDLVTITRPSLAIPNQVWDLLKNEGPHRVWGGFKCLWELDEMDQCL
ncbi:hypothetical protein HO173_011597 [Letharia columbiana]|uniref:Uncharacterized protein n=1 Tax=Letharia columbiana TaxID=112416 RepID=A0A8H6CRV9_9LECA|nr:uncharacterized protein HO173_011597 [Letharia columbiana]KAF6228750.1 hypothetical protein HO173_011597 [Letharia columbiana]